MTTQQMESSPMEHPDHQKSPALFSTFDDIFDHFIDTDSYELSDNTADRSPSDEWENYYDVHDATGEWDAVVSTANSPRISHEAFDLHASWDHNADNLDDYLALSMIESLNKSASPLPNLRSSFRKHRKSTSLDALRYRSLSSHGGLCISPRMSYPELGNQENFRKSWATRRDKSATSEQDTQDTHMLSISPLLASAPLPQSQWIDRDDNLHNDSYIGSPSFDTDRASFPRTLAFARANHTHHFDHATEPGSNPIQHEAMSEQLFLAPQSSFYNSNIFLPNAIAAHESQYGQDYAPNGQMVSHGGGARSSQQPYIYPSVPSTDHHHKNPDGLAYRAGRPDRCPSNEKLHASYSDLPLPSVESVAGSSSDSSMHGIMQQRQQYAGTSSRPQLQHRYSEHSNSMQRPSFADFSRQPLSGVNRLDSSLAVPSPRLGQQAQPSPPRSRKGSRGPNTHHRRSKTVSGIAERRPCKDSTIKSLGFVHYTPEDSRKILSGVAPSGSSKTKARREKEATEKRRRLGQAAAKVVLEPGGDLARLDELERAMSQE